MSDEPTVDKNAIHRSHSAGETLLSHCSAASRAEQCRLYRYCHHPFGWLRNGKLPNHMCHISSGNPLPKYLMAVTEKLRSRPSELRGLLSRVSHMNMKLTISRRP